MKNPWAYVFWSVIACFNILMVTIGCLFVREYSGLAVAVLLTLALITGALTRLLTALRAGRVKEDSLDWQSAIRFFRRIFLVRVLAASILLIASLISGSYWLSLLLSLWVVALLFFQIILRRKNVDNGMLPPSNSRV